MIRQVRVHTIMALKSLALKIYIYTNEINGYMSINAHILCWGDTIK